MACRFCIRPSFGMITPFLRCAHKSVPSVARVPWRVCRKPPEGVQFLVCSHGLGGPVFIDSTGWRGNRSAWRETAAPVPHGLAELLEDFALTGYTCSFPNAHNMEFVRSFVCVRPILEGTSKRGNLPPAKHYRPSFWNRSCLPWHAVNS